MLISCVVDIFSIGICFRYFCCQDPFFLFQNLLVIVSFSIKKQIWNWTQKRKRKKNWIGFFYLYKLQIFYSYFSFQFNQTNKGKKKVFSITSTKPFSLFCSYLTSFTQRRARNLSYQDFYTGTLEIDWELRLD